MQEGGHMSYALVALGGNVGDVRHTLDLAVIELHNAVGVRVVARSRWYTTPAVGGPRGAADFLNGVVLLETSLEPRLLLQLLHKLELQAGRKRSERWAPRTLDLDLLLYDSLQVAEPGLVVPHPRMAFRRFVLQGAVEAAPHMVHPPTGWTIEQLWEHLGQSANYAALSGPPGVDVGGLARCLAGQLQGSAILQTSGTEPNTPENPRTHNNTPGSLAADRPPTPSPTPGSVIARSLSAADAIECLRRLHERLAAHPWERGRFVSSDFWIETCQAAWLAQLPEEQRGSFHAACAELESQTPAVRPRLAIVVDRPWGELPASLRARWSEVLWRSVREAQRSAAARRGVGPVLWLSADEYPRWTDEALAAVQAMQ
jgi:2-amino-4-hydroxy-6-hydroxymethyldihydropteridine diphosphokinase